MEQWLTSWAAGQTTLWLTRDNTQATGYTALAPQGGPVLSINYYDTYPAITGFPSGFVAPAGASAAPNGLLTATRTAVLNSNGISTDMLWTAHYYDDKGRLIKTYQQHYLGGTLNAANYDAVTTTYNFNDQVTTTTRQHYTAVAGGLKLTQGLRYLYDHMGRKLKTWSVLQNVGQTADTRTLISKLDYNEIGQLWKKNLHTTDTTGTGNARQLVTYSYNERGWLLRSSAPLFEELLYYNTGTNKYYNGNIAYQFWGIPGNLDKHYSYSYDQLNRLQQGYSSTGDHENGITYDLMGNIKFLQRYATTSTTLIDRLTYNYPANSNQLGSVTDDSGNALGQKNGTATYGYDLNGNLTSDDSRGILSTNPIKYNLLNLPQSIAVLNTAYTYDANGQKLRKVISGTGASTTEYIGGVQYNGTAIDFIQTEEGRAIPNGAIGYNYEYSLTDHLGNSRVNFDTSTGTTARQVQTDDYYPFGMESNSTVLGTKSLYLYNKKELQQNGLNLYDYGARYYDPAIARWTSVDPLAEISSRWSPYNYVENNPIRNIDPDGMETVNLGSVGGGNLYFEGDAAVAAFKSLQNQFGHPNPPGDKSQKEKEKKKNDAIIHNIIGGPIGANMTQDEREEYNKENAWGLATFAAGEALGYILKPVFRPIASWVGRLFSTATDWAAMTDAPLVGNLAKAIDSEFGNGTVQGVERAYKSPAGIGDIDIDLKQINIEVKSGGKLKIPQQVKNMAQAAHEGKAYIFYMPEATTAQIREAAKNGITVLKNQTQLFNAIKAIIK
ncbi:RHS repeat domain-containing protein [Mucilaginibacter sp. 3215]|uniref:RHS repeat domain-containing protein n=1 Tax=Mucilaginibacter sp. 3215 TaxID=3373912 RepID=UPI003D19D39E